MRDHEPAVRAFFNAYAERMNDALADPPQVDVHAARQAFAAYLIGTDPKSVRGSKNGLLFRLMVPLGYRRYRRLGCKRMELQHVDVTGLDDFHAMARTHWSSLVLTVPAQGQGDRRNRIRQHLFASHPRGREPQNLRLDHR